MPLLAVEHASPNHAKALLNDLNVQREEGDYSDVVLHVSDEQLYAHRCILAANGSFFHNVFTQNQTIEPHHLSFPSTTPRVLKSVLNFIYTGIISVAFSDTDELLALSNTLEINDLKKVISEALQKHLDISNWFEVRQLASKHKIKDVTLSVIVHLSENFAFVKDDNKLLNLDINEMLTVCKRCNLNGDKDIEKDRLQLIFSWISHDYESRERYYAEIMQTVNPDNLNSQTINSFLALHHIKDSKLYEHFVTHALIKFVRDRETFEQNFKQKKTEDKQLNVTGNSCLEKSDVGKMCVKSKEMDQKASVLIKSEEGQTTTMVNKETTEEKPGSNEKSPGNFTESTKDTNEEEKVIEDKMTSNCIVKRTARRTSHLKRTSPSKEKRNTPVNGENKSESEEHEKNENQALTDKNKPKHEINTQKKCKGKRGRPKKMSHVVETPPDKTNVDKKLKVDKNPKPKDKPISEEMKGKTKEAPQQKTSSAETARDKNEDKSTVQSETFPPVTKRPRSKKITSGKSDCNTCASD